MSIRHIEHRYETLIRPISLFLRRIGHGIRAEAVIGAEIHGCLNVGNSEGLGQITAIDPPLPIKPELQELQALSYFGR
jgi:hypothetical protein